LSKYRERDVQKPVWIMKISMAAPIEAPTAAILRYQERTAYYESLPRNRPRQQSPEPTEVRCGAVWRGGEQRDMEERELYNHKFLIRGSFTITNRGR
jgi:hypothetical protein